MSKTTVITNILQLTVPVVDYNINQAWREESTEDYKWVDRHRRVLKVLLESEVGIMCLQELRNLTTCPDLGVKDFLSMFKGYEYIIMAYSPKDPNTFYLATLYDPTRFEVMETRQCWYNSHPKKSRGYLAVRFMDNVTQRQFWIVNTHFHIYRDLKDEAVEILKANWENVANLPVAIFGDFNFFNDDGGVPQRKNMLSVFSDAFHPLYQPCNDEEEEERLTGTFWGYRHDKFNKAFGEFSRLDHCFHNALVERIGRATIMTEDGKRLGPDNTSKPPHDNTSDPEAWRNQPSDHACIHVTLLMKI